MDDNNKNADNFAALVCRFYGQGYIAIMDKVLFPTSTLSTQSISPLSLSRSPADSTNENAHVTAHSWACT
jgi:hypothetical protein